MPAQPQDQSHDCGRSRNSPRGAEMLVNAQADMEVVSEASDGEKAVQTARETKPDVALLDLTMPRVGGMKALEEMARDCREDPGARPHDAR
jgi:DNA-binding NarL/FixJ family response regulator